MTPSPSSELPPFDQPLRLKSVCDLVPMSRSWILQKVSTGEFPPPAYRLGGNAVAWSQRDVIAWLEAKRISCAD